MLEQGKEPSLFSLHHLKKRGRPDHDRFPGGFIPRGNRIVWRNSRKQDRGSENEDTCPEDLVDLAHFRLPRQRTRWHELAGLNAGNIASFHQPTPTFDLYQLQLVTHPA